jgi:hypothetical protein
VYLPLAATVLDAALLGWILLRYVKTSSGLRRLKNPAVTIRKTIQIVPYRTLPNSLTILESMGGPAAKFPIERRRAKPPEVLIPALLHYNRPHTRRESDLVRMRIQHWMDLADAALRTPGPHLKPRRALR